MKKIFKSLTILLTIFIFVSCTGSTKNSLKKVTSIFKSDVNYNNITATFVTTQGEISFFLYPEAAPITVANFINLAKRGYFDNTKVSRAVENFVIQAGDPTGTGYGGPGYTIPDEIVNWLDFYQQGMLAMANAGPNTGGSQFFFTLSPAEWLNDLHTIFGEVKSEADFLKIRKLELGDVIKEIKFTGNVDLILSLNKHYIDEWNERLELEYPNLKKYPIKEASIEEQLAYREEVERIYTRKLEDKKENSFEYPTTKSIRKIFNTLGGYTPKESVITE